MAETSTVPNGTANLETQTAQPEEKSKSVSWIRRIRRTLLAIGVIYVVLVALLCTPFFQRHTVYLNSLKFPFFANFNLPEKYGLAPNKTFNFYIPTPDGEELGAWFVLSDHYYHTLPSPPTLESLPAKHIPVAVQKYPTILFFHGNAATRAFNARIQHYTAFASRLGANVLAVDYRGFADSTGIPSEKGLICDARAAWDWLIRKGVDADDILIVGHSLGTGVSAGLAKELAKDGITGKGLVLLSPFSSIQEVLTTYHVLGVLPLVKPLAMIPWATNMISWALVHKFDTLKAVPDIQGPVLIAHAENDWDIPDTHSDVLFNAFLDEVLPPLELPKNAVRASKEQYDTLTESLEKRGKARSEIVRRIEMAGFGYVESFWDGKKNRNVTLVKTLAGGHDYLGVQEGVQDVIGRMFGFFTNTQT